MNLGKIDKPELKTVLLTLFVTHLTLEIIIFENLVKFNVTSS